MHFFIILADAYMTLVASHALTHARTAFYAVCGIHPIHDKQGHKDLGGQPRS
jgi:hypothetical protein